MDLNEIINRPFIPLPQQRFASAEVDWYDTPQGVVMDVWGEDADRWVAAALQTIALDYYGHRLAETEMPETPCPECGGEMKTFELTGTPALACVDCGHRMYAPVPKPDDWGRCPKCDGQNYGGYTNAGYPPTPAGHYEGLWCRDCGHDEQFDEPRPRDSIVQPAWQDPLEQLYQAPSGISEGDERNSSYRKLADWEDIMEKAKRLIQGNAVMLLRNGYTNVVGTVKGDHGTYEVEIGRQDPASRVITNWHCQCFIPGTRVIMANGATKTIETVEAGDRVLTATGRVQVVKRRMSRPHSGKIVGIKPNGFTDIVWMTPDHRLITADIDTKAAEEWRDGDYGYYPQPQPSSEPFMINVWDYLPEPDRCIEHEGRIYTRNKLYGSTRIPKARRPKTPYNTRYSSLPTQIPFDHKFARLAGLYLAEGAVVARKGEVRWTFDYHDDEFPLVMEVMNILEGYGLTPHIEERKSDTTVVVGSKILVPIFSKLFGTGSRTKIIDERVLGLRLEVLQTFFNAWVDGDGNRGNMNVRDGIGTSNVDLAMQARYILARLGHESVLRRRENNASPLVPGGKDFYTVTWRANGGRGQDRHFFYDDQVYHRVATFEDYYKGLVYNIEVEDEHTYVVYPGLSSANCPWAQFSFDRTRKWKRYEQRPCSHVLATYWKSLGTPLDDQPDEAPPDPGQARGPAPAPSGGPKPPGGPPGGGEAPIGVRAPAMPPSGPRTFLPSGEMMPAEGQGQLPGVPQAAPPIQQPAGKGVIPPFPGEQMQLWEQWQGPGTTDGGQPSPPWAVSVPGAKPTTPFNPVQSPGTYSKVVWAGDYQAGQQVQLLEDEYGVLSGPNGGGYSLITARKPDGSPRVGEVMGQDAQTGWTEVMFSMDENGPNQPRFATIFLDPAQIKPSQMLSPGQTGPRRVYKG